MAIRLKDVDLEATTGNANPSAGKFRNSFVKLPAVTTANLPTAATANQSGVLYNSTTNTVQFSDGSSWANVGVAGSGTLDQAYDSGGAGGGRTITVDSGDVLLQLAAVGSSLGVDASNGIAVTDAVIFSVTGTGTMTDCIDASAAAGITNALNCGANAIVGTTGNITYTNFAFTGATGALICQSLDRATAGTMTIGGTTATGVTITPNVTHSGTLAQTGAATFSAGVTQSGGNSAFTSSATTGDGFLIDGSTVTTGNALRVEYDAAASAAGFGAISVTEDGSEVFVVAEDGNVTIAGTAAGTAACTLTTGDLVVTSGQLQVNPTATLIGLDLNLPAAANLAGGYIDIDGSTGSGPVLTMAFSGAYTGDAINLNMTNAVGANALDITGAGVRTAHLITITDVPTTAAATLDVNLTMAADPAIDIDCAGTGAGAVIDMDFSAAFTGDALNINMTNAVGANALDLTGAGTRTVPLITITDVPTTSAPTLDLNLTAGAAVQSGIDIDVAGTAAAEILTVDFSAAFTGDAVNITMTNAGAAAQALVIDGGQTAASGNIVDISTSSALAGGTGRLVTLTSSGAIAVATEGAVLNIAETGAAQATTYAVQIDSTNNEALLVDTGVSRFDEAVTFKASNPTTIFQNFVQAAGAANAITASLTDSDGANVALTDGLVVLIDLNTRTLQAGANTLNFNAGGAVSIVSSRNVASNIATAYAANGFIKVCYNSTSAVWMDLSQ